MIVLTVYWTIQCHISLEGRYYSNRIKESLFLQTFFFIICIVKSTVMKVFSYIAAFAMGIASLPIRLSYMAWKPLFMHEDVEFPHWILVIVMIIASIIGLIIGIILEVIVTYCIYKNIGIFGFSDSSGVCTENDSSTYYDASSSVTTEERNSDEEGIANTLIAYTAVKELTRREVERQKMIEKDPMSEFRI